MDKVCVTQKSGGLYDFLHEKFDFIKDKVIFLSGEVACKFLHMARNMCANIEQEECKGGLIYTFTFPCADEDIMKEKVKILHDLEHGRTFKLLSFTSFGKVYKCDHMNTNKVLLCETLKDYNLEAYNSL